ncbi:MAG TPA: hypothetical protein VE783_02065 [Candidatus Limnocylindrales bacterium]|nr:hypothetical protein [Candidatus Limnocylindrales bacterium]
MKRCLLLIYVVPALAVTALAMDRRHFNELNKKGRELRQKQDWKALREVLLEIGKELPAPTPVYLLRRASVEAHLGNNTEALNWLERYAAMGLTYDVAADDDLKPLLSDPAWPKVADEMKRAAVPVNKVQKFCTLPVPDLMPEDLTFDGSGSLILSSVRHHSLYRASLSRTDKGNCILQELGLPPEAKRWPVLATSYDPQRKLLWASTAAIPDFPDVPKKDSGRTALLAIDPQTGKLLRRIDLGSSTPALLGDMSVGADGSVYLGDSLGDGSYRVSGDVKSAKLEKIAEGLFSPQTPALARDGKRLFVADYSLGIAVVDPSGHSKSVTYLAHPENIACTGIDGLLLTGNSLIGVQNGVEPARVVRFQLNPEQTRIESVEVLAQGFEGLGEPTHAAAHDGWIYVTANVGWNKLDNKGNLKTGESFTAPVVFRFREK